MNLKNLLLNLHERPIAYYPIYRKISGSTTAGILISQILFWWQRMDGREFYKTDQDIMKETLLTAKELKTAKRKIKELDFISISVKGVPATTYYDVDADRLSAILSQTSLSERDKLDGPKGTSKQVRKGQTLYTQENTQENTTIECIHAREKPAKLEKEIESTLTAEKTNPSKKVAPKKVSRLHPSEQVAATPISDFPESDDQLTLITDFPTPEEVSQRMIEYYTGDGAGTWEMLSYAVGLRQDESLDMRKLCTGWAFNKSDQPFVLRSWKNESRKNLLAWMQVELRNIRNNSKRNEAKKPEHLKMSREYRPNQIKVSKVPV